ncbi:MAG TPA: S8 family serine peptidase [Gaiellaceae bacterium]|nr:S8 family serine peptidase [Gaiellaceae bacterium]
MKRFLAAALAVPVLLLAGGAAAAPDGPSNAPERFLAGFDKTRAGAERAAIARNGGQVTADFAEIGALAVTISERGLSALARERGVAYVERDEWRVPLGLADTQLTPSPSNGLYGLLTTTSTAAHARGWKGQGIKACVADTGLDTLHPDIAPNYVSGTDTISGDSNPDVRDSGAGDETHGTHVAGTVVGAHNTVGVFGAAYEAKLYHARVLRNSGGSSSQIMNGVKWLVETAGCKIVNMSLGGGRAMKTEERFYNSMRSKGALIIAATGNDSAARVSYPAAYPVNVAVGAVDRNNVKASFSNTGTNIDLVAPGVTVLSAVPAGLGSESSVTSGSSYIAYGLEYSGRTSASGVTGTVVDCGLAKTISDCKANGAARFVALIQRGEISFGDKVKNATAAGAAAAVIYNNAPEEFTGTLGAAGTWIPSVAVSGADGGVLKGRIGASATVVSVVSSWDHMDGTSMATPHVSGVAAQVWSAKPSLTPAAVEDHLFTTAKNLGPAGYDTTYGHGLVQAEAAVIRAG